jgi:hypothetical protein
MLIVRTVPSGNFTFRDSEFSFAASRSVGGTYGMGGR